MLDDLTSALAELDLQPGESRTVQVNDYEIEIRRPEGEPSEFADMVMLEPWTEFPRPTVIATLRARPGKLPMPDAPVIPPDDEGSGV